MCFTPTCQSSRPSWGSALWPDNISSLHPLNITCFKFAKLQQDDKLLGPLIQYLIFNNDISVLGDLCKKDPSWVISTAKRSTIIDGLLMYAYKFMDNQDQYHIFVPSDPALQKHFLQAYRDSPMGMHRGHDTTYQCLSRDFYWHNMSKHVSVHIASDSSPFSLPMGLCR